MFDSKRFLRTVTTKPGVYQMLDTSQQVIYVGKAKNLKARIGSYFNKGHASAKTHALVKQIANIKVIVARSESEALILESNLIKRYQPRYNVLFRDDKSYPYLYLSSQTDYPRLHFYRGSRKQHGQFFGPYPSVRAVRETLHLLQRLFKLRSCRDTFFRHRTRPCLQYQIKRCTAPCVGLISKVDYHQDVKHAVMLLEGKEERVIAALSEKMAQFSQKQAYEAAARCRDQIANIRQLQAEQHAVTDVEDLDAIAVWMNQQTACVQILMVRHGQVLGKKSFFPRIPSDASEQEIISAFVGQYYMHQMDQLPQTLLFNQPLLERQALTEALSSKVNRPINLIDRVRGKKAGLLAMAQLNAKEAVLSRLADHEHKTEQFEALAQALGLQQSMSKVECFDVSHTQGEATIASCVVFGPEGPIKNSWRRFNITNITAGDDYAALRQAIERHYRRLKQDESLLPDLLVVDGGRAQLQQARKIFECLQISHIPILGIAKGVTRKPGLETLYLSDDEHVNKLITVEASVRHLLQAIRDEAHRFAITGHRKKRAHKRQQSVLQQVTGIGSKRRQQLLNYFGGLQGVKRAAIEDLIKVPGINRALAEAIYRYLND